MRLSRIHCDATLSTGQTVTLAVDKAHYVKNVLRLADNHQVLLFNGIDPQDYLAQIQISGKTVSAQLLSSIQKTNDPAIDICLMQALGRSEHNDFVVQKATELGASRLIFFNSERTQSPLKPGRVDKKLSHWKSIAISACEQCNRNTLPVIRFIRTLDDCLNQTAAENGVFFDFEGEKFAAIAAHLSTATPLHIVIGAEGGFSPKEIQRLKESKFQTCSIGPRVLRMETAAISALTLVQHYLGDM
jgi:16S rRNA (uracil1498-N3)-methyltransferase